MKLSEDKTEYMHTYELIEEFIKETGLNEDQICSIFDMSRQNIYNIRKSTSHYHRFLRELIVLTLQVPSALYHFLNKHPSRFDETATKLTTRYLKEKGIKTKRDG